MTVWDAQTFTPLRTLGGRSRASTAPDVDAARGFFASAVFSGTEVFELAVSPDDRLVAVARFDGSVQVWDMVTGRDAFPVDPGPSLFQFMSVAWSADGDLLAVVASDGLTATATVVDRTGRVVGVRQDETGTAFGAPTFTPDGAQLVTTVRPTGLPEPGERTGVVSWDWRTDDVATLVETPASEARLSPDGRMVATTALITAGTATGTGERVDVWDPATGTHVAALTGTGAVSGFVFSDDGSRLAIASSDGTLRIWDPSSGEPHLVLQQTVGAQGVAFSPDGSRLASVAGDGVVRVWALDLDELVEIAEDEVTRSLTDEECERYLHAAPCP